ncbi:hypothetical protein DHEL01_v211943 [Diaporthe helianthi]|uniref:Uncharacterized protein n=1 Tax=Diaporthe helianthi TaxID=158607 RepID=A0A2P5HHD9_DIAHE|nr:hypothetical protein DHEL01_v211943 [Diaporthe helianthi]
MTVQENTRARPARNPSKGVSIADVTHGGTLKSGHIRAATATAATAEGRDLATRHEKTLHVDQYSPPDRASQHTSRASTAGGRATPFVQSPGTTRTDEPSPLQSCLRVGTEADHQKNISTPSQATDDISEARAWCTLLGLDGFDHFPNDGFLHDGSLLTGSSSMVDEFPLAAMESFMPMQPPKSNEIQIQALDVNDELIFGRNYADIPTVTSPRLHRHSPPWFPNLPSIRPQVFSVRVSETTLSSLRSSLGGEERQRPTKAAVRLFLGTYFDVFNIHLPMFHAPSFDFDHQPRGLLLVLAAIGALYCLEHRSAALLYWAADTAAPLGGTPSHTRTSEQGTHSMTLGPADAGNMQGLAYFQTRLLLQYFGIFGGDKGHAERSLDMIGEVLTSTTERELTWIGTLYGAWIISDFASSTYGTSDPFILGHDGQLELPCSEALWQAQNEAEWNEARFSGSTHGSMPSITIREAFAQLFDNSEHESPSQTALGWSPFAVVCVMHILSTRFWHVSHGTLLAVTPTPGPTTPAARPSEQSTGTSSVVPKLFFTAVWRCHDFIRAYSNHVEHDSTLQRTKDASWQVANAAEILRVCYGRTVPALARLDFDTLLRGDDEDVRVAMAEHVRMPLERNAEFTLAATVAFEGLCGPLRHGAQQLYRKTGALTGSLEHLVSRWDSVLLLSKWIHVVCTAAALGVGMDEGESHLLQRISDMLQQEETALDESATLAARLLRYWAAFYDDTWVWGVSPRMAVVFRRLATAYQSGPG